MAHALEDKKVVLVWEGPNKTRVTFDDGTVAWLLNEQLYYQLTQVDAPTQPTTQSDVEVARENLRALAASGNPAPTRIAAAQVLLAYKDQS